MDWFPIGSTTILELDLDLDKAESTDLDKAEGTSFEKFEQTAKTLRMQGRTKKSKRKIYLSGYQKPSLFEKKNNKQ